MEAPYVTPIRTLVQELGEGRIQVPRFQRPFVWDDEQRIELLRSIRDGLPIGSVLLWKTDKHDLRCYETLGPHEMAPPPVVPGNIRKYLLDGHQRLSTLFGALHPLPAGWQPEEDEPDWRIAYDLGARDFLFPKGRAWRTDWMPVQVILDRNAHRKFVRSLAPAFPDEARRAALEEEADAVANRFEDYQVPVILLSTDTLTEATRTFARVNSLGTPMDEANMVMALTWSESFDLRERIETVRERLPPRWRAIEDRHVLNVCKGLLDMEINKAADDRLAKGISKRPDLLDRAAVHLREAARHLEAAGIPGIEVIPYRLLLVVAAVALSRCEERDQRGFQTWAWRAALTGAFAGASSTRIEQLVEAGVDGLEGVLAPQPREEEIEAIPTRFDFRSARARTVLLAYAGIPRVFSTVGTQDALGGLLADEGARALHYLFPPSEYRGELAQSAANRIIAAPGGIQQVLGEIGTDAKVASRHLVAPDLVQAVIAGDPAAPLNLLRARMDALDEVDRAWRDEIWEGPLYSPSAPAPAS